MSAVIGWWLVPALITILTLNQMRHDWWRLRRKTFLQACTISEADLAQMDDETAALIDQVRQQAKALILSGSLNFILAAWLAWAVLA